LYFEDGEALNRDQNKLENSVSNTANVVVIETSLQQENRPEDDQGEGFTPTKVKCC